MDAFTGDWSMLYAQLNRARLRGQGVRLTPNQVAFVTDLMTKTACASPTDAQEGKK